MAVNRLCLLRGPDAGRYAVQRALAVLENDAGDTPAGGRAHSLSVSPRRLHLHPSAVVPIHRPAAWGEPRPFQRIGALSTSGACSATLRATMDPRGPQLWEVYNDTWPRGPCTSGPSRSGAGAPALSGHFRAVAGAARFSFTDPPATMDPGRDFEGLPHARAQGVQEPRPLAFRSTQGPGLGHAHGPQVARPRKRWTVLRTKQAQTRCTPGDLTA
jgi:plasmid stabilization system protein ParE